jgi:hypothetical protein
MTSQSQPVTEHASSEAATAKAEISGSLNEAVAELLAESEGFSDQQRAEIIADEARRRQRILEGATAALAAKLRSAVDDLTPLRRQCEDYIWRPARHATDKMLGVIEILDASELVCGGLTLRSQAVHSEANMNRGCSCHQDDGPPTPCAQRYALADCLEAARSQDGAPGPDLPSAALLLVCERCGRSMEYGRDIDSDIPAWVATLSQSHCDADDCDTGDRVIETWLDRSGVARDPAGEASGICTQISDGTARYQDGATGPDLGPGRTPNQTHDLYPRGK